MQGSTATKKKKKKKAPTFYNYSELAAGYDENDSFIDNSEAVSGDFNLTFLINRLCFGISLCLVVLRNQLFKKLILSGRESMCTIYQKSPQEREKLSKKKISKIKS